MKKLAVLFSVAVLALVVGLALSGYLDTSAVTGNAASAGPTDLTKSVQVGVVILAALGILGVTLVNVVHKEEDPQI